MPGEDKDLYSAVGESFGIQDAPAQDGGQQGDDNASQMPDAGSQGQGTPQDGADSSSEGVQPAARQPAERGQEQLFSEKPRKGPRGELLDKQGNVIAASRREKQLAYNLNRAQYAANIANREIRSLRGQLQAFHGVAQTIQRSNLSSQHVNEAIALRAQAERDPIGVVRNIVAQVLASGVTMEQIFGGDAVPAINARIVTNELDKRLGPLERREQAYARQERLMQGAQTQLEDFVYQHEHAATHGVEISQLVDRHGLTPEKAYYELRSWAERRGFDFSQPLQPQVVAAIQRSRNGQRRTTPAMRGGGGNGAVERTSRGDFRSDAPWRDIAKAVFSEINNRQR